MTILNFLEAKQAELHTLFYGPSQLIPRFSDIIRFSFLSFFILFIFSRFLKKSKNKANSPKEAPLVSGCLPIVGHGLQFTLDKVGFLRSCYQRYGAAFRIKIFRVRFLVLCNKSFGPEIFKASDDELGFYDMLKQIYLGKAFESSGISLKTMLFIIKKGTVLKTEKILKELKEEADILMTQLHQKVKSGQNYLDIFPFVSNYVARSSARCLIGIDLSPKMFDIIKLFSPILNNAIILSYFLPPFIIKLLVQWRLNKYAKAFSNELAEVIEPYRKDGTKCGSAILRAAVDEKNELTGRPLNNEEIGNIVLFFLYVSSENTSLGFINALMDLSNNPQWGEKVWEETELKSLDEAIKFPTLHASLMETARLNSHLFAISRLPAKLGQVGGFSLDGVDAVTICGLLVHIYGSAEKSFSNPTIYNPGRFLGDGISKESFSGSSIMTWGTGVHGCPGKIFATYEIKVALIAFLTKFKIDMEASSVSEKDYFAPTAFVDRKMMAKLILK